MPSRNLWPTLALLFLGAAFAGANLWHTAARSTIPLALHGTVANRQRLIEKTAGVDDVYLVTLDSGRRLQLDRHVFDALADGQSLDKPAWSRTLEIDGRPLPLEWSSDLIGMLWVMPLTLAVCIYLAFSAARRSDSGRNIGGQENGRGRAEG